MKTTDDQIKAFFNLCQTRDGELIRAWLKDALEEADAGCHTQEGPRLYRAQGKAVFIKAFLKAMDDAVARMKIH